MKAIGYIDRSMKMIKDAKEVNKNPFIEDKLTGVEIGLSLAKDHMIALEKRINNLL